MEKSTTDKQEELDGLNEIVSFTEDVLERMDAKSIAGHLTLVKRVGVILITFTSILRQLCKLFYRVSRRETQI